MKISIIDGSNYFKGLLLLIRKDHKITETEIDLMKRIGKRLGFEKDFCDTAIQEILKNKHIVDVPPEFSSKELTMMFIKDGLALALSDNELDRKEEKWLRAVVEKNSLDIEWFLRERDLALSERAGVTHLEADDLIVEHLGS